MYFQAFRPETSVLPNELTFTVESLVSQILAGAHTEFLKGILQEGRLVEALMQELDFVGHIPRDYVSDIRRYLLQHETSLSEVTEALIKEPWNRDLRDRLSSPSSEPGR